jgi:uncharacterized membrane protein YfcA
MLHDPWFYAAAIPAMLVLGLSKGGLGGLGLLVVPTMSLVISPIQAAGITLPILVLTDIVAVISYWGVFDRTTFRILLPSSLVGILLAWLTAAWVTEGEIRLIVGLVSILFALNYWFRHRQRPEAQSQSIVKGSIWGIVAGFTSFVSHAGGPPFQVYAAPLRLKPRIFAGTQVLLFAIINATKVLPYFFLGQFDTANLTASVVLLPFAIPATFLGVWLVRHIDIASFYKIIYALVFVIGVYLVGESVAALV